VTNNKKTIIKYLQSLICFTWYFITYDAQQLKTLRSLSQLPRFQKYDADSDQPGFFAETYRHLSSYSLSSYSAEIRRNSIHYPAFSDIITEST